MQNTVEPTDLATRTYSRRERVLFALFGALVFLPFSVFVTYRVITVPSARSGESLLGLVGGWAVVAICARVARTGASTRFLDLDIDKDLDLVERNPD